MIPITGNNYPQALQSYYRWHASIYDFTRWSFLFGRDKIIQELPVFPSKAHMLEIGCGTGKNLNKLAKHYPQAKITGIDLSPAMLRVAASKTDQSITLTRDQYEKSVLQNQSFNLILLSYSLTMMKLSKEPLIEMLKKNLSPDGFIAVVDFHQTNHSWFRHWMLRNHVEMDKSLLSSLKQQFEVELCSIYPVYAGLWSYFIFIGRKGNSNLAAKCS